MRPFNSCPMTIRVLKSIGVLSLARRQKGLRLLLCPRLVSFREGDKKPEDATTVQELIELYQSQGKK